MFQNLGDNQYFNLEAKDGWFVDYTFTNKEEGTLNEFIEKEGKWFNYIKGVSSTVNYSSDLAGFNVQGIGVWSCIDSPASGSGECISSDRTAAQGVVLPYLPWGQTSLDLLFGYMFANPSLTFDDVKWHVVGGQAGSCTVDSNDPNHVAGETNYWMKVVSGTNQRWKTFNTHGGGYGAGAGFSAGGVVAQELMAIPVQSLFTANSFFYAGYEYIRFDTPSGNGFAYDVIDGMAALYNNNHGGN